MNESTNQQLLRNYAERRSEADFAELVRRHIDLVYSVALRMVCDSHLAEDVTQSVFIALAQNASHLTDRAVLSGWLHRAAQNLASKSVRTEVRRRAREQEAAAMNELLATEIDVGWKNIAPHLDTALGELNESDRDALLLRYFEGKSAREMASILNVSEEAAQKRVNRAVERLREIFSNRNVTIGASGLVVLISANAVQAAPIGLLATISTAISFAGTASTAIAATKTMAMTTLQKTLITTALVVAAGAGIYEARRSADLQKQIQSLRQQSEPSSQQIQQLQSERDDLAKQLADIRDENERLNRNTSELLKLRNKVSQLQSEAEAARKSADEYAAVVKGLSSIPPVKTFVATTQTTAAWNQAVVTGGWKTPSGKRAIVLITLERDDGQMVTIRSKILEFTEEVGQKLGLNRFNVDEGQTVKAHPLNLDESDAILGLVQNSKEIEVVSSPTLSSLSGRQAELSMQELHSTSSGEKFSTGPVIDLIPTISPDGNSVHLIATAQLNYLVPNPLIK